MNKILYKLIIALGIIFSGSSCDSFMDVHEEFIQGGERIYAPVVDSVTVFAGHNRVVLKLRYFNGNNLDRTIVYWNDYLDSIVVSLKQHNIAKGLDSIEVNIPNLVENSYSFNVINYDLQGNKSLNVPAFGSSYGEQYRTSIINRNIRERFNSNDNFIVRWSTAPDQCIGTEVRYIDLNNQEATVKGELEEENTYPKSLNNQFIYRSIYKPEVNAVDVFYTEWSVPILL